MRVHVRPVPLRNAHERSAASRCDCLPWASQDTCVPSAASAFQVDRALVQNVMPVLPSMMFHASVAPEARQRTLARARLRCPGQQ